MKKKKKEIIKEMMIEEKIFVVNKESRLETN